MNRTGTLKYAMLPFLIAIALILLIQSASAQGETPVETPEVGDPTPTTVTDVAKLDAGAISTIPSLPIPYTVTLAAWRNLRPTESYLRGISMLPSSYSVNCKDTSQKSKGWIVGESGVILGYCNGAWDHAIIAQSIPTLLTGIQAISPTLAVASGDQGAVMMYLYDRIAKEYVWTKAPTSVPTTMLYGVSMVYDSVSREYKGWIVGKPDTTGRGTLVQGRIYRSGSVDGHQTYSYSWNNVTSSYSSLPQVDYYYSVQTLSITDAWAVGGIDGVKGVIIHWNGSQWSVYQEVGTNILIGLYMRSPTDGWAVGKGGVIYHFNGTNWTAATSPTTIQLFDVNFTPQGEGWAVGLDGTLLRYTGGEWELFTDLRTDAFDFRALDFTSGHGWMVGYNDSKSIGGHILEYDEGLWLAVTPPTDNRLNAIKNVSDNEAWAVGAPDALGGTIIRWDGKHWQRWFQQDPPIPAIELYTVDLRTASDGWAAGDTSATGKPAILLRWDGYRWAPPLYDAPVTVRINSLDMLDGLDSYGYPFGWAVATEGSAIAKYDGLTDFWSANHSCGGLFYNLRGVSVITDTTSVFGWDAWAVGSQFNTPQPANKLKEGFLRYEGGCLGGYAWDVDSTPGACINDDGTYPIPDDGAGSTVLYDIAMRPEHWGFAVGDYKARASVYYAIYNPISGRYYWQTYWCRPQEEEPSQNPSRYYSVSTVNESGVVWIGGYRTNPIMGNRLWGYIAYIDYYGRHSVPTSYMLPSNGWNIYHRPIRAIEMSSDTMGWAVGDGDDALKRSVIYQYPFPNYTLQSSPAVQAVMPGETATYTITVDTSGDITATIQLFVYDLPPGVTYTISPSSVINTNQKAVIQLHTSSSTPLGYYETTVWGYSTIWSGDNEIYVGRQTELGLYVTDHPIYSVSPSKGPAGTLVTITGNNFGADPGVGNRSTTTNPVFVAGVRMPDSSITSWSNTKIVVLIPDNPTLFPKGPVIGLVSVARGGTTSNQNFNFQLENYISEITAQPGSGLITITIQGTSFGDDPGASYRSTYLYHINVNSAWIPTFSFISWSNNQIQFTLPTTTSEGTLSVISNGYESNLVTFSCSNKVYIPLTRR